MSTSIFVSRSLEGNSPILELKKQYELDITDQSLLKFEAVVYELPDTRWLFFYSKTAVKYFVDYCSLAHYKVCTFGPVTARYAMRYGSVSFHCDTNAEQAVEKIQSLVHQEAITFVVGRRSLRSVQKILPQHINHSEVIVYDQHKMKNISIGTHDIAVLTSPMNVQSFFDNGGKAAKYISIGHTTAAALERLSITPVIAASPSEVGIAHTLGSELKSYF